MVFSLYRYIAFVVPLASLSLSSQAIIPSTPAPAIDSTQVVSAIESGGSSAAANSSIDHSSDQQKQDEFAEAILELFERAGSGVRIRGLGRSRTELNSREIFTVPGGHALSWSDVSSVWMAGVDTYKSPDASMIEGGPGGTLNIRTLQPLSTKDRHTAYQAQVSYNTLMSQYDPRIALLHSRRWQSGVGEVGALFNVIYGRESYRRDKISLQPFYLRTDLATDTELYVPRGAAWKSSTGENEQRTFSTALQWQPGSSLLFTWQSLATQKETQAWDYGVSLRDSDSGLIPVEGTQFSFDQHGSFQSGRFWSDSWRGKLEGNGPRLNGSTHSGSRSSQTYENSIAFSYAPDSRWAAKGDIQYLNASTAFFDFSINTSTYVPALSLDLSRTYPSITYGDFVPTQTETFWNSATDHWEDSEAELISGRLDLVYDLGGAFGLSAIKFGGRKSEQHAQLLDSGYNWGSLSDHWNAPLKTLDNNHPVLSEYIQLDNFFDGRADVNTGFYLPARTLLQDSTLASKVLSGEIKSGADDEGWHLDSFQAHDHSSVKRDTHALYSMLMLDYNQTPFGPMSGHLGVRMVESSVDAEGYAEFKKLNVDDDSVDAADMAFANGQYYALKDQGNTFNLLPSAYFELDLAPELIGRVAASKTITQPQLNQLKPYGQISAETETLEGDDGESLTEIKRWYGKAGNPTLKPVKIKQYDASLEWHFSDTGNIYSALFYKQLSDSHERALVVDSFSNNGQTREVEVERLTNAGDANIQGVEFGLRHKLGFLPGALRNIAWQTTFTKISSRSTTVYAGEHLPLEGLSKNNLAISGTYQNRYFSTTFNYDWRSDYLLSAIDVGTSRSTWHKGFGRLDASVALNVSKNSQLALVVQNIGNNVYETERGPYQAPDGRIDAQHYDSSWTLNDPQWKLEIRGSY